MQHDNGTFIRKAFLCATTLCLIISGCGKTPTDSGSSVISGLSQSEISETQSSASSSSPEQDSFNNSSEALSASVAPSAAGSTPGSSGSPSVSASAAEPTPASIQSRLYVNGKKMAGGVVSDYIAVKYCAPD